jgi:hypothetical protein
MAAEVVPEAAPIESEAEIPEAAPEAGSEIPEVVPAEDGSGQIPEVAP